MRMDYKTKNLIKAKSHNMQRVSSKWDSDIRLFYYVFLLLFPRTFCPTFCYLVIHQQVHVFAGKVFILTKQFEYGVSICPFIVSCHKFCFNINLSFLTRSPERLVVLSTLRLKDNSFSTYHESNAVLSHKSINFLSLLSV